MLTNHGVRQFIRRSHVPLAVWAKRAGVNRVSLSRFMASERRLENGPMSVKLRWLVEAYQNGEWHFIYPRQVSRIKGWDFTRMVSERPQESAIQRALSRRLQNALSL